MRLICDRIYMMAQAALIANTTSNNNLLKIYQLSMMIVFIINLDIILDYTIILINNNKLISQNK